MQTKEFHLGDVLSIITERLISPRGINGVYEILNFMTGVALSDVQLGKAMRVFKPHLRKQFPQLATPEMDIAITKLVHTLKAESGKVKAKKIVGHWLSEQIAKYGKTLVVVLNAEMENMCRYRYYIGAY